MKATKPKSDKFIPIPKGVDDLLIKQGEKDKTLVIDLAGCRRKCLIPFPMSKKDYLDIKFALKKFRIPLTTPDKSSMILLAADVANFGTKHKIGDDKAPKA